MIGFVAYGLVVAAIGAFFGNLLATPALIVAVLVIGGAALSFLKSEGPGDHAVGAAVVPGTLGLALASMIVTAVAVRLVGHVPTHWVDWDFLQGWVVR